MADLDIDGVPGRESHSHEVSNTTRGLTTATSFGMLVTLGGGRFFSGVPHPHLLGDRRRVLSANTPAMHRSAARV